MQYNISCLKCKNNFVSEDEANADGEGFCPKCTEEKKEIAKKVDEQIAARRASRQPLNNVNVYTEARKLKKGTVAYMNLK